jgi:benzoate-CoA ligase
MTTTAAPQPAPQALNAAEAVLAPAFALGLADALALIFRGRGYPYREVAAGVNRAANALLALGLRPDERVLLLLKDSPELVFCHLGAIKAGGVAVTLNLRADAEELAFAIADSGCALLLLDAEYLPLHRAAAARAGVAPRVLVAGAGAPDYPGLTALLDAQSPHCEAAPRAAGDMAFWIYTSGTTGRPKAAVHRQDNVLLAEAYLRDTLGVGAGTRLHATSKLFFAYALGTCLFGAFRLGATTILHDGWPTPRSVAERVARDRPEVVFSVPALYRAMLREGVAAQPALRAVRAWVSAGEALPAAVYRGWREATGAEIVEGMGATETVYMFLSGRPGDTRAGSAGRPAPGAELKLVDARGQAIARPGEPGTLRVRMASTCAGYWNQPRETRAALPDEWFATGDRFVFDEDGRWRHLGRQEDLLPGPGGGVNPADIEAWALALGGVTDAAAVAVEEPAGGDPVPRRVLFAVAAAAQRDGLGAALRAGLAGRQAEWGAPWEVRWLEALPRTASGKVQRYRLRAALAQGREGPGSESKIIA